MKLLHVFALAAPLAFAPLAGFCAKPDDAADAFVAQVRQEAAFLEQSSEAAMQATTNEKIAAYAKQGVEVQKLALADLPAGTGLQLERGAPLTVASNIDHATPSAEGTVLTGRSAAIDTSVGAVEPADVATTEPLAAPGVIILPELAKAKGAAFDELYRASQAAALRKLIALYGAYSSEGKVPELRALALRGLYFASQQLQELQQV